MRILAILSFLVILGVGLVPLYSGIKAVYISKNSEIVDGKLLKAEAAWTGQVSNKQRTYIPKVEYEFNYNYQKYVSTNFYHPIGLAHERAKEYAQNKIDELPEPLEVKVYNKDPKEAYLVDSPTTFPIIAGLIFCFVAVLGFFNLPE